MKQLILLSLIVMPFFIMGCQNQASSVNASTADKDIDTPVLYEEHSAEHREAFIKCDVNEDEYYRLIGLSYKDFDQDFEGGWRAISSKEGCKESATHILKSYIANHQYKFDQSQNSLKWHTGQVLAGSGHYEEAISYFKHAYKDEESQKDWNLYVDGTIAFLEKDKATLVAARNKLAVIPVPEKLKEARRRFLKDNPNITMPDGFIDEPGNLSVMNKLIKCFDEPYSVAYGSCKK